MTDQEAIALMGEVQADARAFDLLSWRAQQEPGKSFGSLLKKHGDPRLWPEYSAATKS